LKELYSKMQSVPLSIPLCVIVLASELIKLRGIEGTLRRRSLITYSTPHGLY